MSRALFTPEELAELAAFDAEVDAQPDYDPEEVKAQRRRDTEIRWENLSNRERAIAERRRAYCAANREKLSAYQRAYREDNREEIAAKQRVCRVANRDEITEKKRAYYAANREAITEKQRIYREANRDEIAAKYRAYYAANREEITEKKRAYYAANREEITEKNRKKYRETTSDQNAESSPLRQWRREHGYTQRAAALLLGVTQPQISCYERGFTPPPERVVEMIG